MSGKHSLHQKIYTLLSTSLVIASLLSQFFPKNFIYCKLGSKNPHTPFLYLLYENKISRR